MARAETEAAVSATPKTTAPSSVHAVLGAVSMEPIESTPKAVAVSVRKTLRDATERSNSVAIAAADVGLALAFERVHEKDRRWSLPRPVFSFTLFAVVSRAVQLRASALLSFQKWAATAASTRVTAADAIATAGAAIVQA